MHAFRSNLLRGSEFATAQFDTIRLRLLKIGTRIEVGKTFIRFHFPASYPMQPLLARSFSARSFIENGFWINATPSSRIP